MLILGTIASSVQKAAGAFESIATVTGNGSATQLTFSSIPSSFQHLQIRGISRDTNGFNIDNLQLIFNSDTGSNYVSHYLRGDGSSASATGPYSAAYIFEANAGYNLTAGVMGASIIDIHDYGSTSKYKTVRGFSGMDANTGTTVGRVALSSCLWLSTSAITSITIKTAFNYIFNSSSTFALYGIKGA